MKLLFRTTTILSLMLLSSGAFADCDSICLANYYQAVDRSTAATMRDTLHATIDDHTLFPYTSSATDTWDILEQADEDPDNPDNIITIYRNTSYPKQGGGNSFYNREHSWPKSYGFPDNDGFTPNYPFTDMHHLFLADSDYNFFRSNKPFSDCAPTCIEYITDFNNGRGGSGGDYPGDSNWTDGEFTDGRWEVWGERRGDIARAMFYMDVRYAGGTHGVTGALEPDLILTDDRGLIGISNTGSNQLVGYMGLLSTLLKWHDEDPPDAFEKRRHEVVATAQGNRNPFIDHPDWVKCVFGGDCPAFQINPGLNDAWFNPQTDGQGFFITVFADLKLVSLAWFTYDTERPADATPSNLGEPGHRWLTALGTFTDNIAEMNITISSGGLFDTATEIARRPDGTITLTFDGCSSGHVEYNIPSIQRQGNVPIQRVAKDNIALCEQLSQP